MSGRLVEQQQVQAKTADVIAEREHAVAVVEQKLNQQSREIEAQSLALKEREADISSRMRQLETDTAELAAAREMVFTMQAQLERDHHEVASQREELLQRLGITPPRAAAPQPSRRAAAVHAPSWRSSSEPKPASTDGAEQFRKLRRDSKRKAIGV